jgi:hypothetical protein
MRHCGKLCGSGCGGSRATFTGHEYLLLFKCGGGLSTKVERTPKINCGFSNVIVNFCGIFTCPTSKKNVTCYSQMIVAIVDVPTSFNFFPRSIQSVIFFSTFLLLSC